ncbi:MAG: hypothetical protein QGH73_09910 [Rhodospirillales bacterium]|jgi:hypothetical protein|nr:hypothetical protein [Rhodospirillales bacterium]MDP6841981.1 hypothetical protein [Rhodospirillales bacterium]
MGIPDATLNKGVDDNGKLDPGFGRDLFTDFPDVKPPVHYKREVEDSPGSDAPGAEQSAAPSDLPNEPKGDDAGIGDAPGSKSADLAPEEKIKEQFMNDLAQPGDEADEILLKRPGDWTEDEMAEVMRTEVYRRPDDQIGGFSNDQVTRWHEAAYGAQGRPPPVQPKPGPDLDQPLSGIADALTERSDQRDKRHAVMDLQSSINALPSERGGDGEGFVPTLAVDGDLGPKTRFAVKKAVTGFGLPTLMGTLERQFGYG